jgi:2-succinyl-5-enolpyruvyl-6-hydroxy-3-cyclohexene-1-carboxylate synthase
MQSNDASPLTDWARLLLGSLAQAGVEHVVISPGSRSTPFAWAALETPGLVCHSALDERAGAFFALGQARITGRPSLLVCTSGSAAAQYYPAMVEASMSAIPLIALTADRPVELQDAGASQCLDQSKLYAGFVRGFFELGHPDVSASALDGLVRMASQAVAAALGPLAGPVHLNAKARKPLEPAEPLSESRASEQVQSRLRRGPTRVVHPAARVAREDVSGLAELCTQATRGLIVCGPVSSARHGDARALFELARAAGYPLVLEATSQARFHADLPERDRDCVVVGAFETLAATGFVARMAPELVIVLGSTPASSELERLLARGDVPYAVVSPHGHHDPSGRARILLHADPFQAASVLAESVASRTTGAALGKRREHAAAWAQADDAYYTLLEDQLAAERGLPLTEPSAVRAVLGGLPRGSWLGLGNSLPVRDVDAFVRPCPAGIGVWSQRGLSGIDGLVSGAVGAASVARAPCAALIGDVTFLHDVSGLALANEAESPLALVVLDNGGGRIFETLPVARVLAARPEHAKFWLTPHTYDFRHAAALYGVPYHRAEDSETLRAAVERALERPGCTLIHALVSNDSCRTTIGAIRRALAPALASSSLDAPWNR